VDTTSRRHWDQRRFIALGALLSGLALPITGLADHLAGHSSGPDAVVGWSIVHVALGTLFVAFVTWHAVLNRRALLKHLSGGAAGAALRSPEAVAALVLVGGVLALTVTHAVAGP
jgi:uncharacterized membrane protein